LLSQYVKLPRERLTSAFAAQPPLVCASVPVPPAPSLTEILAAAASAICKIAQICIWACVHCCSCELTKHTLASAACSSCFFLKSSSRDSGSAFLTGTAGVSSCAGGGPGKLAGCSGSAFRLSFCLSLLLALPFPWLLSWSRLCLSPSSLSLSLLCLETLTSLLSDRECLLLR